MHIGRVEFNRTPYGYDFSINADGLRQHFAAWYLRRCDFGFYIFGRHFVWSLDRGER